VASLQSYAIRLGLNYIKATTDWAGPVQKLRRRVDWGSQLTWHPKDVKVKPVMAAGRQSG
jgi:hypothetical protein